MKKNAGIKNAEPERGELAPARALDGFDDLLRPDEVAKLLRLKNVGSLAVWRSVHRYDLPFVKLGSRCLYRRRDVLEFIARNFHKQKAA
jgi:hypothetical protein